MSLSDKHESESLMELIRRGRANDEDALDQLLNLVRYRIKGFYRVRAGADEMSDFAQEIIAKVWQGLPGFSGETAEQFWAWVTEVARNRWTDEVRKETAAKRAHGEEPLQQGSGSGLQLASDEERPSQLAMRQEGAARARASLARLAQFEQVVIQRRYFEDQTWPEIAEALGKTEAAVKRYYYRALDKWRTACGGD